MESKFEQNYSADNIKLKLEKTEAYFKVIDQEITANLKLFDDIKLENKQAYETINRNLDDVKEIYQKDLVKLEESVDKSVNYNEALFQRVEKDAHYLHEDQESLRKKLQNIEKRVTDMEEQIGNLSYS